MYKNKNILSLIVITLLLTLSACNKFLEFEPYGPPQSGNYWKTATDAIEARNALIQEINSCLNINFQLNIHNPEILNEEEFGESSATGAQDGELTTAEELGLMVCPGV